MTDWVRNTMVVFGSFENLHEFMQDLKLDKESKYYQICESVFPCPPELYDVDAKLIPEEEDETSKLMESKYGVHNWYEWQQKHWGLKWGDCDTIIENESYNEALNEPELNEGEDIFVRFSFNTAWDAPTKAFERISKMFPNLQFEILSVNNTLEWKQKNVFRDGVVDETELDYNRFWDE